MPSILANQNFRIFIISLLAFLTGLVALLGQWPLWASVTAVVLIDLYIFSIMLFGVLRQDKPEWLTNRPALYKVMEDKPFHGSTLLFILALFFMAIILLFADIYIKCQGIVEVGTSQPLVNRADACYFSLVTLATVGYGDFIPTTTGGARWFVMFEIANGFMLLLLVVPMVIARISERGKTP